VTRDEATNIVTELLIDSENMSRSERSRYLNSSQYPELGVIYQEFIQRPRSTRWFFQAAIDHLIVANSKLGKALK
jgi:hypothetical protein